MVAMWMPTLPRSKVQGLGLNYKIPDGPKYPDTGLQCRIPQCISAFSAWNAPFLGVLVPLGFPRV